MKSDQTIGEYPINLIIRLKSGAQKLSDDYELHSQKMSKTLTIIFLMVHISINLRGKI